MDNIYIISDCCSNHNQDFGRARELIKASKRAGCDAVKFQLYTADTLWNKETCPEFWQAAKETELDPDFIKDLCAEATTLEIDFGVTVFDLDTVKEIHPYVDFYKIASYEMMYHDLIDNVDDTMKPHYVSTGMATRMEIDDLMDLDLPFLNGIFHCISNYPAIEASVGPVRQLIASYPGMNIGWSDHTADLNVMKNMAWDVDMFEFHIDLDDRGGVETNNGHCWPESRATIMIEEVRTIQEARRRDDWDQRQFRTNPKTGLRG